MQKKSLITLPFTVTFRKAKGYSNMNPVLLALTRFVFGIHKNGKHPSSGEVVILIAGLFCTVLISILLLIGT